MRIGGDLRDGFPGGDADGAMQPRGVEDRILHQLRERDRIRITGLQVRRVRVELVDAAPFGDGEQPVGDTPHPVVELTIERAVGWNQHQPGAEPHGFDRRHRGTHTELADGIAGRGDDTSRRRTADRDRLSREARIFHDGSRREHGIDVTEQDLAGPTHDRLRGDGA